MLKWMFTIHTSNTERHIKWVDINRLNYWIFDMYTHTHTPCSNIQCLNAAHGEKMKNSIVCFLMFLWFILNLKYQVMAVPMGQSKRRRIDGIHSSATGVGEGLIEIEVLSISGECMLTLNVADSMLGRELWKKIVDELPVKPGRLLMLSHNTSKLVLHESLQQQGFRCEREQVSATYVPINLRTVCRFAYELCVDSPTN